MGTSIFRLADWHQWHASGFTLLPCMTVSPCTALPLAWQSCYTDGGGEQGQPVCILESGKAGRYTYVVCQAEDVYTTDAQGDVLQRVRAWMGEGGYAVPPREEGPPFIGGVMGYVSYDVARTLEHIPTETPPTSPLPDVWFLRVHALWAIDHHASLVYSIVLFPCEASDVMTREALQQAYEATVQRCKAMEQQWMRWSGVQEKRPSFSAPDFTIEHDPHLHRTMTREAYVDAAQRIQQHIAQGDVYQVNLSVHQTMPFSAPPLALYDTLRHLNPSPYMAYVQLNDQQSIVSASPECLFHLRGRTVTTRPIAGTRPRGATSAHDKQLATEMLLSEKERAEHIMLVDLERNDIGKIAQFGTVDVTELMAVEQYSHVMHIVSEVTGQLREGLDAFAVLEAMFPGGTITGAPKVRTMQLLETLEPTRRGVYTGSLGWIDYRGDAAFNILIRTIVCDAGIAHIQAGAGIVQDSNPHQEYTESLHKATALWKAIVQCQLAKEHVHDHCHR